MKKQLAASQKAGADGDAAASAAAAAQKKLEDEIAALKKQVSSQEVVQRVMCLGGSVGSFMPDDSIDAFLPSLQS